MASTVPLNQDLEGAISALLPLSPGGLLQYCNKRARFPCGPNCHYKREVCKTVDRTPRTANKVSYDSFYHTFLIRHGSIHPMSWGESLSRFQCAAWTGSKHRGQTKFLPFALGNHSHWFEWSTPFYLVLSQEIIWYHIHYTPQQLRPHMDLGTVTWLVSRLV